MNENETLKYTELDQVVGSHQMQLIKAAIPYIDIGEQKLISIIIKVNELTKTVQLFNNIADDGVGICSIDTNSTTAVDMLNAIKIHANDEEQDMIDLICNFVQGSQIYQNYQETIEESANEDARASQNNSPIDMIKNMLPPEQLSKLETYQMLMQAFGQTA